MILEASLGSLEFPLFSGIALRAHEIWEALGCPEGREHEHWLAAEREIMARKRSFVAQIHQYVEAGRFGDGKTAPR